MADFDGDVERTIAHEGGATVTNYPWDPGGLTKYGIAKRFHPKVDVANLTLAGAKAIYRDEYWGPAGCEGLPEPLAYNVLDAAVNLGPGVSQALLKVPAIVVPTGTDAFLWARVARYSDITARNIHRATTLEALKNEYAKLHGWLRRCLQVRLESAA